MWDLWDKDWHLTSCLYVSSVRSTALNFRVLSFLGREIWISCLYQTQLWPFPCSLNLHAGLTEVMEQEKHHVPALQLRISLHRIVCESSLTRFYFQLQLNAMALLLTGCVPIRQSHSILVACQPHMPKACPHFLFSYMMKSVGSHSLWLRNIVSYSLSDVKPEPEEGLQMLLQ